MEKAELDPTTIKLAELQIALAQARGLAAVMGRCAVLDPSLQPLEVAAITDAQLSALDAADHLLAEARREHALSVAQGRLNLRAAAAHRPLRIVAGLDTGEA